MESVRIYEMPACRMAVSPCGMFGDGVLEPFAQWFSSLPRTMFPRDFLSFDERRGGFVWFYMTGDGVEEPRQFEAVDFPGGLYAVATDVDGRDNAQAMAAIHAFINEKGCFEVDGSRVYLGNIITPPAVAQAMGYNQMDYYVPIRIKEK